MTNLLLSTVSVGVDIARAEETLHNGESATQYSISFGEGEGDI